MGGVEITKNKQTNLKKHKLLSLKMFLRTEGQVPGAEISGNGAGRNLTTRGYCFLFRIVGKFM